MGDKAVKTAKYILEKVAPLFNKKGYFGTSLSDITEATGLTKGAIYGNFKNKDELALHCFNFSLRSVMGQVSKKVQEQDHALDKLKAINEFYRGYVEFARQYGGCVMLNKGLNANFQGEKIGQRLKEVVEKLKNGIKSIIEEGKSKSEIDPSVNSELWAGRMYAILQGGVYMATILDDQRYLDDIIEQVNKMIEELSV